MDTEWRSSRSEAEFFATRCDVQVAERAAREWGVLSLEELHACGLDDDGVAARVRSGRLHRLHRAVYAVGHRSVPPEGRLLAAVKAGGQGTLLVGPSAAEHWRLLTPRPGRVHIAVAGARGRRQPGLVVHRFAVDPIDRTVHRRIAVTSPARTLLDCAAVLDARALRRAVREAQALRLVRIEQLVDVLTRLRGRRGCRKLASIVATGAAPTRSVLEDTVFDLMVRGDLARPDVNVPLWLEGRKVVPDFRWPAQRLIVEADGAAWHDHRLAREDDAERQALLERHGERVVRVTWEQAVARPAETLARIRAAGAPHRVAT